MNKRRELLAALGAGALAATFCSFAQQQRINRIGVLSATFKSNPLTQAFVQELRALGYTEGQNLLIVDRVADGNLQRLPAFAAELVAERVDVIFADSTNAARAARQATASIPIVFSTVSDPVGSGFVASLARPGGNITGTTSVNRELAAKRLQLLKEILPKASRVAVLTTDEPQVAPQLEQVREAASRLGMTVHTTQVLGYDDFDRAKNLLRNRRADSICVVESIRNYNNRKLLTEFAAQNELPAIYPNSDYANAGGLVSYGANYEVLNRRAAHYVDKILKGAKPADLPVEQPTAFEMVINQKTAKVLGLTIPQSLLMSADKVIE